jgi:hypothetical protein
MPGGAGRSSSAADRLLALSGLTLTEYLDRFNRVNVIPQGRWNPARARQRGALLRMELGSDERVLVLGKQAWGALGLPRTAHFFSTHDNYTLLPHPSGRNILLNNPEMRRRMRLCLSR